MCTLFVRESIAELAGILSVKKWVKLVGKIGYFRSDAVAMRWASL